MARTFVRQATQIRKSDTYDDTIVPTEAAYETNPVSIEDDLNSVRSQIQNMINRNGSSFPTGNWWGDLSVPGAFENGKKRGINELNTNLHDLERKRVLVSSANLTDVTIGSGNNYVILASGALPTNTVAAIGSTTQTGSIGAYNSSFGSHSLVEVTGSTAIAPKNLCEIVSGSSRDQIFSDNRVVYALFQTESNTVGSTLGVTTPNRAQLSFVRINATGDDLEAVPFADIEGRVINYASVERKALYDLNEQDFLRGAILDNAGSSTQTRQIGYDNQGATPVELTSNATLDLGTGLIWAVRDLANAQLFGITEGSAGGTSAVTIAAATDTFTSNAVDNNFYNGTSVDTNGTQIDIGITGGTIETTGTDALHLVAGGATLSFDDSNRAGSSFSAAIALSATTTEWDNFETNFGEVSLINAINQAYNADRRSKVYSVVNTSIPADTNVSLSDGNVDVSLGNLSLGTFTSSYDVYLNGELLRPGANASANNDYYPGTDLSVGQLKFEFPLKSGDTITVVSYSTKIA